MINDLINEIKFLELNIYFSFVFKDIIVNYN